ncbi:T9SS type A sorting domain-containing protein [Hymenobacter sp. HSC-4F20]|uniref:reprolysin-like metallopeptidase n=1 Tax=Hymenobacter sp. HSC-4F20 TaxID=2864135 RepID=UPI001C73490D|nr:zinc-dependent metalloprotease family protein [Hymenobacter sp. HSC-4F20]MBX0292177.1 T9SS type A sorting domain-containing protein [Hymenobacter sp. HSC-4F20]
MPDTSTPRWRRLSFLKAGTLVAALGASITSATAQRVLWADAPALSVAARRATQPLAHFRSVTFQLDAVRSVLQTAPAARGTSAAGSTTVLSLPLPDGTSQRFRVVQTPVMAPALAAAFPSIQTYAAQGIDDPTATARLDVSPDGFHAMILAPDKTVYIDPAVRGAADHLVFERRAMNRAAFPFVCATPSPTELTPAAAPGPVSRAARAAVANGTTLRTYRLALACTGEYAAFHGGTKQGAMAGMVASINRVNGIYEKELAVRLVMVPNNESLIFLNAAQDPYSNDDGVALLDENQTVADSLIGPANYDIGHVFSTGGGGIAQKPSVCVEGKARGVTGSPAPQNDAFDVDYVAHEMGHQFGADHTFNSTTNFCSGNRTASAAYEPGSGSTIMAYAGICGADDLQPNSDPYFHSYSFDQIVAHITGAGNCAVATATGNTPPVVNAGRNYAIPLSTPFVLTGSATDANGDALTYSWEQFTLGPSGAPNSPAGDAPIFRAFSPTATPSRTFPRLADLLGNTQTKGELLPTYGRRLTFRLVARDNRAGGGGVDYDSMQVVVVPTAGPFVVRAPNSATAWVAGASQQVIWDVANTSQAPVNAANVDILLSTDGGLTYPTVLLANTPNDGFEAVTVPASVAASSTARVRVQASGGIFFDISNQNLTLTAPTGPTFFLQSTVAASLAFCPGTSATLPVSVGQLQGFSGDVALSATNLPTGVTVSYGAATLPAGGSTTATITAAATAPSGTYTLQLTGTSGGVTRVLDVLLTIQATATQAAIISTPVAAAASTLRPRITWAAVPSASSYEVQVATDGAFSNVVVSQTGITGTSFTTALLQPSTQYYLRVRAVSTCAAAPYSATREFRTGTHTLRSIAATQVPRTIGTAAGATATSTIVIGNTERVSDLRIRDLVVTHPDISELEITLTNPARRQTVLLAQVCSGTANLNLSFADDGSTQTCPLPAGTTVRPAGYLGDLLNDPALGSWTLTIRDTKAARGGTLTGWKLDLYTLNEAPAAPSGLSVLAPVITNNMASIDLAWLDNSGNETSFEIERAQLNTSTFSRIATVGANVTAYTDQVRTNGTFCYRVRAINATGASAYSNEGCQTVSTVTNTVSAALLPGISVYPNPSADVFTVQVDNSQRGPVTLRVVDALGRSIATQTLTKSGAVFQHPLDLRTLAPGVYNLHLDMPDGSAVVRLLKQ